MADDLEAAAGALAAGSPMPPLPPPPTKRRPCPLPPWGLIPTSRDAQPTWTQIRRVMLAFAVFAFLGLVGVAMGSLALEIVGPPRRSGTKPWSAVPALLLP